MTGVSSTCIVHLLFHFFPFLLSTFAVANGVVGMGRLWSLFTLVTLGGSGRLPWLPVSTYLSKGWYICHPRGRELLG